MALQLDPKTTALVVIDLQQAIMHMTAVPYSCAEVAERSKKIADALREKGGLPIFVRVDIADFTDLPVDAPSRQAGSPPPPPSASELVAESGVQPGDPVVTKRHWGAFAGTDLEQILRDHGIETVILTGVATNFGVESTARQGTGLGFPFVIVEDACSALDVESHRFAFEKIFPRLTRVRSTDEVIAALG